MDILRIKDVLFGPLFATFLLVFTTVVLLYWHTSRKQSYWKKKGIPYVEPLPFLKGIYRAMTTPMQLIDMDRFHKYGRIYGNFEGNRPVLSVAEPELLRNIFLKDFYAFTGKRMIETGNNAIGKALPFLHGEDWKRIRSIVSPTFSTGKIKRMTSIFTDCSQTLVKNFREASKRGEPIDAKSIYGAFTMDIIASTAFSTKLDSHNDPNNKFVTNVKEVFSEKIKWSFLVSIFFPRIVKFFRISLFPRHVINFFKDTVLQIIEERKRTGQTRNDFLQLLMDIAKEAADEGKLDLNEKDDITENYGKLDNNQIFKNYYANKTLSHEELVAQCVMFFIGGYDTTASTLTCASYSLALHPDIQERAIQEIDEAVKVNNGDMTYEAIQSLKFLDNIIAETLRLYTPLMRLERIADEDYKLGDTGLTIPKGMVVTVPVYAMHRDPELFPDPETFDPDRFSAENRSKQVPYSYLPFGAGPRNCLAMRFALMEVKVCLAHVLRNFRIKKCSTTKVPLEFEKGIGLLQPKNVSLFMEIRKDSAKAL